MSASQHVLEPGTYGRPKPKRSDYMMKKASRPKSIARHARPKGDSSTYTNNSTYATTSTNPSKKAARRTKVIAPTDRKGKRSKDKGSPGRLSANNSQVSRKSRTSAKSTGGSSSSSSSSELPPDAEYIPKPRPKKAKSPTVFEIAVDSLNERATRNARVCESEDITQSTALSGPTTTTTTTTTSGGASQPSGYGSKSTKDTSKMTSNYSQRKDNSQTSKTSQCKDFSAASKISQSKDSSNYGTRNTSKNTSAYKKSPEQSGYTNKSRYGGRSEYASGGGAKGSRKNSVFAADKQKRSSYRKYEQSAYLEAPAEKKTGEARRRRRKNDRSQYVSQS